MDQNVIGDRLYYLRTEAGLTIEKLASLTGISSGHLSALESGSSLPSMKMLIKLCDYYKLTLPQFFIDRGMSIELNKAQRDLLEITDDISPDKLTLLNEFIKAIKKI